MKSFTTALLAITLTVVSASSAAAADCDSPLLPKLAERQLECLAKFGDTTHADRLTSERCIEGAGLVAERCAQLSGAYRLPLPIGYETLEVATLGRGTYTTLLETDGLIEAAEILSFEADEYLLVLVNGAVEVYQPHGRLEGTIALNGNPLLAAEKLGKATYPLYIPIRLSGAADDLTLSLRSSSDTEGPGWLQMFLVRARKKPTGFVLGESQTNRPE